MAFGASERLVFGLIFNAKRFAVMSERLLTRSAGAARKSSKIFRRPVGDGDIAGIKRNPRLVFRFEFGVVVVGRVWFRLDFGCRSPV